MRCCKQRPEGVDEQGLCYRLMGAAPRSSLPGLRKRLAYHTCVGCPGQQNMHGTFSQAGQAEVCVEHKRVLLYQCR